MGKAAAAPGTEEPAPQKDQPKDAPGTAIGADVSAAPGAALPPKKGPKPNVGVYENSGTSVTPNVDAGSLTVKKSKNRDYHVDSTDPDRPDLRETDDSSLTVTKDSVGGSLGSSETKDGVTKKQGIGATIKRDGFSVSTSSEETTEGSDDKKGRTNTLDVTKDSIGMKSKPAGDGIGGGASIGKDGVNANVTWNAGDNAFDIGGGVKLKVEGPTKDPASAMWLVSISRIASLKGSAGNDNDSRGASVDLELSGASTIKREFETEAKAKAWAADGAKLKALFQFDITSSTASRDKMAIGETRIEEDAFAAGATASVNGPVTVTLGGTYAQGAKVEIKRISKSIFEVTRSRNDEKSGSAGGGAYGFDVTKTTSKGTEHSETWSFDTSKGDQSNEFEAYLRSGTTPKAAKSVGKSDSVTDGDKTKFGSPIMSTTIGGTMKETDSVDADGKKWKEIVGEHSLSWASSLTEDKHASNQSFRAMIDQATGSAVYGISAGAGGTDGSANQRELGLATETGTTGRDGVAASGDWTVTSYFTEAEIDAISSAVVRGKGTTGALPSLASAGAVLKASLAKAHDTNAQARAIATYVKETGPKGLGALRTMAGLDAKKQRDEISLAPKTGTSPFLGPDGRAKLQSSIIDFQRRIDSPEQRSSIAKDISTELIGLDLKLSALRHDKYPDLPVDLLIEERERVTGFITVLETLRASTAETNEAAVAKASARLDGKTHAQLGKLGEATELCSGQQERANTAFTKVRKFYYRHIETTVGTTRSMRGEFAGWYDKIDKSYATAVTSYDAANAIGRTLEARDFAVAGAIADHGKLAEIATKAGDLATYYEGLAKSWAHVADLFSNVLTQLQAVWDDRDDFFTKTELTKAPEGI